MPNIQATLQHEIELTSEKFQRFLILIPEASLHRPSKDINWTNAEILYKISVSPLLIHSVFRRNFGPWTQRVLPLPGTGSLFPRWDEKSVRSHARRISLFGLAQEYHNNCNEALKILNQLEEQDFQKTVVTSEKDSLLSGRVKVEELFHYIKKYFDQYRPLVDLDSQASGKDKDEYTGEVHSHRRGPRRQGNGCPSGPFRDAGQPV